MRFKAAHEGSYLLGLLCETSFLEFGNDAPSQAREPVVEGRCRQYAKSSLEELNAFGVLPGQDARSPCLEIKTGGATASASVGSARQLLQTVGALGKPAQ